MVLGKGDLVGVLAIELVALAIVVCVDVLGFLRPVVIHVRFGGARTIKIVDTPVRIVDWRVPTVARGMADIAPLEERPDHLLTPFGMSAPIILGAWFEDGGWFQSISVFLPNPITLFCRDFSLVAHHPSGWIAEGSVNALNLAK